MALTLDQLNAIRDGMLQDIATARVTAANGASVDFVADKEKALKRIEAEIANVSGAASGPLRRTVITTSKGF